MRSLLLNLAIVTITVLGTSPIPGSDRATAQPANQTAVKWSKPQLEAVNKNCIRGFMEGAENKFSLKVASTYCQCFLDIASRRCTVSDYGKNEEKIVSQMEEEGVIQKCVDIALSKR
jgi:hypothetical protein